MLKKTKLESRFEELPAKSHNAVSQRTAEADKATTRKQRRRRPLSYGSRSGSTGWSVRMW